VGRQVRHRAAEQGTRDDVARVVDPGVNARIGDEGGERLEGDRVAG
jgi:hypothetical protein